MRAPADMSARRRSGSTRGRVVLIVAAVVLFILATSLRGIAGFWTDYLWFESLDLSGVFTGILWAQVVLAAIFTAVFLLVMWLNLSIADRIAPKFRPAGPEEELLEKYHDVIDRRAGVVRLVISFVFALMFGLPAASQWNDWILFTNAQSFGQSDALFGIDIGFYVFQLPFLLYVVNWLFASLIIVLIVTGIAHYLNGGIRVQTPLQRVTPQVKVHLSVLLAALALVKAGDYYLQRFELLFSTRGVVDGATYTDVNAQLPAINLLLLISLAACLLFIVNIWLRGWVWPATAVALWAFAAIIVGSAYPAFVQRFQVEPEESTREAEFIDRNISATRDALGLDNVTTNEFDFDTELSAEDLRANADTIRNIRILDQVIVKPTYERLQADRGFYQFVDLDVDRYVFNEGENTGLTQVVIASRELNTDGIPQKSWEGERVAYTHGYGLAVAPSNEVTDNGRPNFVVKDVPVTTSGDVDQTLTIDQPQIYFGEGMPGYAIVGTEREEIDYVDDDGETVQQPYEGEGGVNLSGTGVSGWFRRAAFAARFWEIEPLISNFITDESKAIYIRDIRTRVEKVAPFLSFDADPYPVILDGDVYYVLDGYTTSSNYPYGQYADVEGLAADSGLHERFNYVRNSAKAVVNAFDGDVTLYQMPVKDPILDAYRSAFPELFDDFDNMPDGLEDHLRFPEDMFRVQTTMWARYHLDSSGAFYDQSNGWEVAQDPGRVVQDAATREVTNEAGESVPVREQRIAPVYQLMQLPGEADEQVLLTRPFVPFSEEDQLKKLSAFMTAGSDRDQYGDLTVYEMPGTQVDGPAIVDASINNDDKIASEISLLDQRGSTVQFGEMMLVPIDNSIIYVRPLYVTAEGDTAVPELRKVIAVIGEDVAMGDDLLDALTQIFVDDPDSVEALNEILGPISPITDGDIPPEGQDPNGTGEPAPVDTVSSLLAEADALMAEAATALDDNDLGTYQGKVAEAGQKIAAARALEDGTGGGDGGGGDGGGGDTTTTTEPDSTTTTTEPEPAEV